LIVPPVVAWWQRASMVLRVYPGRVTLERGVFSKCYREFLAKDIRSLDIDQGVLARMVDIGTLKSRPPPPWTHRRKSKAFPIPSNSAI